MKALPHDFVARYWQWYESLPDTERPKSPSDFGREMQGYPAEPNLACWHVESSGADYRAWPDGIDDPGLRALFSAKESVLHEYMRLFESAAARWSLGGGKT
jgi:hypothetical protein